MRKSIEWCVLFGVFNFKFLRVVVIILDFLKDNLRRVIFLCIFIFSSCWLKVLWYLFIVVRNNYYGLLCLVNMVDDFEGRNSGGWFGGFYDNFGDFLWYFKCIIVFKILVFFVG